MFRRVWHPCHTHAISLKYALAAWVCSRKMHKHEGCVGMARIPYPPKLLINNRLHKNWKIW